jgi:hypothetical protein
LLTPKEFKWDGYQACTMIRKVRFKELAVSAMNAEARAARPMDEEKAPVYISPELLGGLDNPALENDDMIPALAPSARIN